MERGFILPSSPRYFYQCKRVEYEDKLRITVTDLFHGSERRLEFPVDTILPYAVHYGDYDFLHISSTRFIIFVKLNERRTAYEDLFAYPYPITAIYFLELDFENGNGKILHSYNTEILNGMMMLLDEQQDRTCFAIIGKPPLEPQMLAEHGELKSVFIGRFNEETFDIEWDWPDTVAFPSRYGNFKLVNHVLYGMKMGLSDGVQKVTYWKLSLLELETEIDTIFEFKIPNGFSVRSLKSFQWSKDGDVFYVTDGRQFFAFNVQTCEISQFQLPADAFQRKWVIDNEDVLTFHDSQKEGFQISRHALRKPESLLMAVWFAVSKHRTNENKLYKCASKLLRMDSELQPFYFEPSTSNPVNKLSSGFPPSQSWSETEFQMEIKHELTMERRRRRRYSESDMSSNRDKKIDLTPLNKNVPQSKSRFYLSKLFSYPRRFFTCLKSLF